MHSMFLIHRSVAKMLAAAFVAALFAMGSAPALAAPALTATKVGSIVNGHPTFTLTFTNAPQATDSTNSLELLDPLPGIGTITWSWTQVPAGWFCTFFAGSASPFDFLYSEWTEANVGPTPAAQQVGYCDYSAGLKPGESAQLTLTGDVLGPACQSLDNTLLFHGASFGPPPNFVPLADGSADGSIVTGADCRMTGGGSIFTNSGVRITHGFEIRCDASDPRQNLEINWAGDKNGKKGQNNFHLTSMTSAQCLDTPIVQAPPKAPFDTYVGRGVGTCNGAPAKIDFVFTDAGEPGKNDTAMYQITGACTLDVGPAYIHNGNQQAH